MVRPPLLTLPVWVIPPGVSLRATPVALRQADLFLLQDHVAVRRVANHPNGLGEERVVTKDGVHARLLHFVRGEANPRTLYLRFDDPRGRPPVAASEAGLRGFRPAPPDEWMFFAREGLFLGREESYRAGREPEASGLGSQVGVWIIPAAELGLAK